MLSRWFPVDPVPLSLHCFCRVHKSKLTAGWAPPFLARPRLLLFCWEVSCHSHCARAAIWLFFAAAPRSSACLCRSATSLPCVWAWICSFILLTTGCTAEICGSARVSPHFWGLLHITSLHVLSFLFKVPIRCIRPF